MVWSLVGRVLTDPMRIMFERTLGKKDKWVCKLSAKFESF